MSTKLRAYYQHNDTWKSISRWEVLSMTELEYNAFRNKYTLHLNRDCQSEKLTFNKLQRTFRYYPNSYQRETEDENGMTISHLIAQEVICSIDKLNLKLTDKRTKTQTQHNIIIRRSNSMCEYREGDFVFDIRIFFNEPHELALKWGGKLNIEVLVTSKSKPNKIAYCEEKKEPLIEVRLSEKLLSKHKISEVTEPMEREIRDHIERAFTKQIYADILVSPSSESYLANKVIASQAKEISKLKEKLYKQDRRDYLISKISSIFQKK